MECHIRALPTPLANDGSGFHTNIPVNELIERDTRAIEASIVNSAPPVVETEDGVTRENTADPYQTLRGSGARAARSKIERPRFEGWPTKGPRPPRVKQAPREKMHMSLSGLCPADIEAGRVISTL